MDNNFATINLCATMMRRNAHAHYLNKNIVSRLLFDCLTPSSHPPKNKQKKQKQNHMTQHD